jgi:hypothetical protein
MQNRSLGKDIRTSCASLENSQRRTLENQALGRNITSKAYLRSTSACEKYLENSSQKLVNVVARKGSLSDDLGLRIHHAPRICPTIWLIQLRRDRFATLTEGFLLTGAERED